MESRPQSPSSQELIGTTLVSCVPATGTPVAAGVPVAAAASTAEVSADCAKQPGQQQELQGPAEVWLPPGHQRQQQSLFSWMKQQPQQSQQQQEQWQQQQQQHQQQHHSQSPLTQCLLQLSTPQQQPQSSQSPSPETHSVTSPQPTFFAAVLNSAGLMVVAAVARDSCSPTAGAGLSATAVAVPAAAEAGGTPTVAVFSADVTASILSDTTVVAKSVPTAATAAECWIAASPTATAVAGASASNPHTSTLAAATGLFPLRCTRDSWHSAHCGRC